MKEQKLHPKIEHIVEFLNYGGIIPDIYYGICSFKIGNDTVEFFTTDDQDNAESFHEQYIWYRINDEHNNVTSIRNFKDMIMMMLIKEQRKEIQNLMEQVRNLTPCAY